jgi:outer membrane protein TolC
MELVELEQENVVAARQNLELQRDRFEIGATTSLDFRDAQVNLARAESSLITARFQARIARLAVEKLVGDLAIQ